MKNPFEVNSTGDSTDATPGDFVCDTGGTNSGGDPECTLRAAIEEANAFGGADTIEFNMPAGEPGHSAGIWTITPGSELPLLSQAVTIDATTQTGYVATPVVELNGASAGAGSDGFRVFSANVEIRAFAVNRFLGDGIEVDTTSTGGTVIAGNHIGLDASGLVDRGNSGRGIDLQTGSGPTTVGGTNAADRNVISGNGGDGIIIWGSDNNVIVNNFIGTDVTGNASGAGIGNLADGIAVGSTSAGNVIGQAGYGNVLSGNGNDGFENGATGAGNTLYDNTIGLGADGSTVVSNGRYGVVLYNGVNNTQIGGSGIGEGNVISGNSSSGLIMDGASNPATTANVVAGNIIGLDATGMFDRGNAAHGIHIFAGANANTIGGPTAAHGNVISGNGSGGQAGVFITDAASSNNVVQHNIIGTNAAGDAAIMNNLHGINISNAPDTDVLDNLISGNNVHGVYVSGASTTGTEILRNTIGTNAAIDAPIANGFDGVRLESGSTGTVIGSPGNGNTISGNSQRGIDINNNDANIIQGNWIGTDPATGAVDLGNGLAGVYTDVFGSSNNTIGGAAGGEGNTIAFNGEGITLDSGTNNSILGNNVYSNDSLGIDLDDDGITPNSNADAWVNYPVITSAIETAGTITVDLDLDLPAGDYRIELFKNPSGADPTTYGEGETYVDFYDVVSHPGGLASYSTTTAGAVGDIITATATEEVAAPFGATSEFSAAVTTTMGTVDISGTVFEDIVGDVLNDGVIGDANNPGLAGVDVVLVREGPTPVVAESAGDVGQFTSIAIGSDGNPVVAYYDVGNADLKVLHCDDPLCQSSSSTTVGSTGDVGQYSSIAIGADGFPIISFYDATNTSLRIAHCNDAACTSATTTTADNSANVGSYTSIAIGVDNLAIASYYDTTNGNLMAVHCDNTACTASTTQTVHSTGDVGQHTSIVIGSDGLAAVSYYDVTNGDLRMAHCTNLLCSTATTVAVDTTDDVGTYSTITIAPDGFPRIASFRSTNSNLRFAQCLDTTCSTTSLSGTSGFNAWGGHFSMIIGADGDELISGYDSGAQQTRLVTCASANCGSLSNARIDFGSDVGQYTSIALGNDGVPVIAYYDATSGDLKLALRDGLPGSGDRAIATETTDGSGNYTFSSVPPGVFFVSAHSRDAEPTAGYASGGAGDVWAEQTYGSAGAYCADGLGGTSSPLGSPGPCYGGRRATSSDASSSFVTNNEHVNAIDATSGSIANLDFGFSFNVVTNTLAGNTLDHDFGNNRTVQGSLRQFIQNANAAAGPNSMRLVPAEPPNDGTWWEITVSSALPAITDVDTTIDGTAYELADGSTVRDTNTGFLGTNAAGGTTVGVDGIPLPQVEAPELELHSSGITAAALEVRADNTTIRKLAIYGFGDTGTALTDGDIEVPSGLSVGGLTVAENVIGTGAGAFADPGAGNRSGGSGVTLSDATGAQSTIQNNLFGYLDELAVGILSSDTIVVTGNEVIERRPGRQHLHRRVQRRRALEQCGVLEQPRRRRGRQRHLDVADDRLAPRSQQHDP